MILYNLVSDDDGHEYAVTDEQVNTVYDIFKKEWDDWTEEEQDIIDSLHCLDGADEYYIVLKSDLRK